MAKTAFLSTLLDIPSDATYLPDRKLDRDPIPNPLRLDVVDAQPQYLALMSSTAPVASMSVSTPSLRAPGGGGSSGGGGGSGGGGSGGGRPPGGGEETAGNNLSYPVVFIDAPITSIPADVAPGAYNFAGNYVLVDGDRAYVQKDSANDWRAESISNAGKTIATYMDVGDNLESQTWRTTSKVRVEFAPYTSLSDPLTGFQMAYVSGQGTTEVWGAKATDADPSTPIGYPQLFSTATVHSPNARLNIAKLEAGNGTPDGGYTWDTSNNRWTGVADQISDGSISSEVNVQGKVIYGQQWDLKKQVMEPGVSKDGWYRLTFYTGDDLIDFQSSTQKVAPPLPYSVPTTESEGDPTYQLQIDEVNELAYIDVYIRAGSSGGGGGGKPSRTLAEPIVLGASARSMSNAEPNESLGRMPLAMAGEANPLQVRRNA